MSTVLELFNQKEMLNYLRDRKYPVLLGEELFPEVKRQSLEFDMLTDGSRTPVIASVHGFDTESEIGQREAQRKAIELALIKRKMQLKERELIALESPRNEAEKQYLMKQVYKDFDKLIQGIKARVELMRMEIIAKGTITLNENGLNASISYGVPNNHKAANVDWNSENSDPIADITTWCNAMAVKPKRALTSNTILMKILRNSNVVKALYGPAATRVAVVGDLNTYLESNKLPKIYTYDEVYKKENSNGTYTTYRYFPENCFSMFPEGPLGETIYGPTAEEVRLTRDPSIQIEAIGKILAMMYEEGKDPVSTWEKAVATALPTCPYADELFQAEIELNPSIKELEVTVAAGSTATKTKITEISGMGAGTLKYKTASSITAPEYLDFATGYSELTVDSDITVTSGHKIIVVEVDRYNKILAKSDVETVVVGS